MDSMSDYSSDELEKDEVIEIKKAMREAKARKKSISRKLRLQLDRNLADKDELENIILTNSNELSKSKQILNNVEFDLREARFEIAQLKSKEEKNRIEQLKIDLKNKQIIHELKASLEKFKTDTNERNKLISIECDRIMQLLQGTQRSLATDNNIYTNLNANNVVKSRTVQHLHEKAINGIQNMKNFVLNSSDSIGIQSEFASEDPLMPTKVIGNNNSTFTQQLQTISKESYDSTLLDMCRSLEDENINLSNIIEALKGELSEAHKDSVAVKLIPHYRLAIVRSRSYAANLLEQIKREQVLSLNLKEQLEATYADLKKVVEEKRRLYMKLSKESLQQEEKELYLVNKSLGATNKNDDKINDYYSNNIDNNNDSQQINSKFFRTEKVKEDYLSTDYSRSFKNNKNQHPSLLPDLEEDNNNNNYYDKNKYPGYDNYNNHKTGFEKFKPRQEIEEDLGNASASLNKSSLNNSKNYHNNYNFRNNNNNNNNNHMTSDDFRVNAHNNRFLSGSGDHKLLPSKTEDSLKVELNNLDLEIDELKEKLEAAAMFKSQRIINDVLDSSMTHLNRSRGSSRD
eukprot:gene4237-6014_t